MEGRRTPATAWVPTTDIFAMGDDLVICCELAGVERNDVDISLCVSDHRRVAQGRARSDRVLRAGALLRELQAEDKAARRHRWEQDLR